MGLGSISHSVEETWTDILVDTLNLMGSAAFPTDSQPISSPESEREGLLVTHANLYCILHQFSGPWCCNFLFVCLLIYARGKKEAIIPIHMNVKNFFLVLPSLLDFLNSSLSIFPGTISLCFFEWIKA